MFLLFQINGNRHPYRNYYFIYKNICKTRIHGYPFSCGSFDQCPDPNYYSGGQANQDPPHLPLDVKTFVLKSSPTPNENPSYTPGANTQGSAESLKSLVLSFRFDSRKRHTSLLICKSLHRLFLSFSLFFIKPE